MPDKYIEIGNSLRKKRIELGKELEEISEAIKVSTEYLKAIESGNFKTLPSIVYFKLFVRSYAQEMGIDGNKLLEEFDDADEALDSEDKFISDKQKPVIKRSRPENETPLLKIGLILAIVVIIVFAAIIIFVPREEQESETGDLGQTDGVTEINSDSQSVLIGDTTALEETAPEVNVPMRLGILIKDSCWIVVAADGDTVLENTLQSGIRKSYTADYRFLISIGNPYNVELRINDTLLRDFSNQGRVVKGFEINRLNKADLFYIPEDSLVEQR